MVICILDQYITKYISPKHEWFFFGLYSSWHTVGKTVLIQTLHIYRDWECYLHNQKIIEVCRRYWWCTFDDANDLKLRWLKFKPVGKTLFVSFFRKKRKDIKGALNKILASFLDLQYKSYTWAFLSVYRRQKTEAIINSLNLHLK